MVVSEELIAIPLKDGSIAHAKEVHNNRGTIIAIDEETDKVFYSSIPQRTWMPSTAERKWEKHRSCETFIEDRQKRLAKIEEDYEAFGKLQQEAEEILEDEFQKAQLLAFLQKTKNALKGRRNKQLSAARTIAKEHFEEHNRLIPVKKEKKEELIQAVTSIAGLLESRQTKLSRVKEKYGDELTIVENFRSPPVLAETSAFEPF